MPDRTNRRQVVSLLAGAASAGLAGCFTVTQSESTGSSGASTATGTDGESTPTDESPDPDSGPSAPAAVDSHLTEVSNYDGTVVDARGRDTVTVAVATRANGGACGFVATGTFHGVTTPVARRSLENARGGLRTTARLRLA
jgi:hypothetical protein